MSKTKKAIERKFPRYKYVVNSKNAKRVDILDTFDTVIIAKVSREVAGPIVASRNAMFHELVKTSELLVEIEESWSL
jgi:hypothetical protein